MADAIDLFLRQFVRGARTAAPTTSTFGVGDLFWNEAPGSGGPLGWVCVTAGSPGTWVALEPIKSKTVDSIAAAGAVNPSYNVVDIDTGGFNITLTAPTSAQAGSTIAFVNDTASPCTLIVPSGTTLYAGSAVISANTSAQVKTLGGNYYRI